MATNQMQLAATNNHSAANLRVKNVVDNQVAAWEVLATTERLEMLEVQIEAWHHIQINKCNSKAV